MLRYQSPVSGTEQLEVLRWPLGMLWSRFMWWRWNPAACSNQHRRSCRFRLRARLNICRSCKIRLCARQYVHGRGICSKCIRASIHRIRSNGSEPRRRRHSVRCRSYRHRRNRDSLLLRLVYRLVRGRAHVHNASARGNSVRPRRRFGHDDGPRLGVRDRDSRHESWAECTVLQRLFDDGGAEPCGSGPCWDAGQLAWAVC
jgi:hypothetical protein